MIKLNKKIYSAVIGLGVGMKHFDIMRENKNCEVKIIDDGIGLPTDFNWDQSSNLGLQIVKTLTENELKGSIQLIRVGSETQAVLKF